LVAKVLPSYSAKAVIAVKYVEPRHFANPDLAARKLVEIANIPDAYERRLRFVHAADRRKRVAIRRSTCVRT
jgi:hypothetical protein